MSKKIAKKLKKELQGVGLNYLASADGFYDMIDECILSIVSDISPLSLWVGEESTVNLTLGGNPIAVPVKIMTLYGEDHSISAEPHRQEAEEDLKQLKIFREQLDQKIRDYEKLIARPIG